MNYDNARYGETHCKDCPHFIDDNNGTSLCLLHKHVIDPVRVHVTDTCDKFAGVIANPRGVLKCVA